MQKIISFIDKTDIIWYNTDMNNLVYAGNANPADGKSPHAHNGYEIICFSQYGEVECDGRIYAFSEGDAAIIPPRTPHNTRYAEGSLRVILEQALLPVRTVRAIRAKNSEGLFDAVRRASAYFKGNFAEKGVILAAYGNLIAAFVTAYSGGKEYSPVVAALMDSIDANFGDPLYSLENAIRALPLNYDYIRKMFLKETGVTPHEYLTRKRMERARDIILSGATNRYSQYTVSQIAEACGFTEPLYFSKVFKKYFGVAPSQFSGQDGATPLAEDASPRSGKD